MSYDVCYEFESVLALAVREVEAKPPVSGIPGGAWNEGEEESWQGGKYL
jgi:hypothetical protein